MPTGEALRGDGTRRAFAIVPAATALGLLLVLAHHASTYFFLFDDYALVGLAAREPLHALVAQPVGGFWRPVALLLTRPEAVLLGFGAPWVNASVSAALHVVVALLVGLLGRDLLGDARAGAVAGMVFGLSPWASESYFWLSSRFDLLCVLGYVTALLLGRRAVLTRRAAPLLVALSAAVLSLGSKETGVTLPVALAIVLPWKEAGVRGRGAVLILATGGLSAAYLGLRASLLPGLGGAYGSFGELLERTDLVANLVTWVRAVGWPATGIPGVPGERAALLHAAAGAFVVAVAAFGRRATAVRLGLALGVSVLPVAWSSMPAGSTASGRYAYLPGVFLALLAGAAAAAALDKRTKRLVPGLVVVAVSLLLVSGLFLVEGQRRAFREAAVLARRSIEALAPWAGTVDRLYIPNLPSTFAEGPYVLKPYALRFYFGVARPTVRAEAVTLTLAGGVPRAVSSAPDLLSEHAKGSPEIEIVLPAPRP